MYERVRVEECKSAKVGNAVPGVPCPGCKRSTPAQQNATEGVPYIGEPYKSITLNV